MPEGSRASASAAPASTLHLGQATLTTEYLVALEEIAAHHGALLIDFDETLFLRNSTECFIDCAWPGTLALLLLRLLDVLKPWRFGGGEAARDNWRAGLVAIALPWTWWRWRRRCSSLAAAYTNRPLVQALRANRNSQKIIVSIGFSRVIAPLAKAMGLEDLRIIGSRLFRPSDRGAGKLAMCMATLGPVEVAHALVLTDSETDMPLLQRCRTALLVRWPQARFEEALRQVYLPGQYISRIKHPGQRYILRGILQEDFAFWLLASLPLALDPLWHCIGLLLLLLSFWTVYEQGYVDNDHCAALYEENPKLSASYLADPMPPHTAQAWTWSAVCGGLGLIALEFPQPPQATEFLRWAAVLLGTWALFRIYNRVDKSTRVWLYSGLQLARGAAFVAVAAISPIGAAALGAHIFARWAPYYFYRQGGRRWLSEDFHLMRLLTFVWLGAMIGFSCGPDSVLNLGAAALLGWNIFRARKELLNVWRQAHRIDRRSAGA